jgi:hypothetical protein
MNHSRLKLFSIKSKFTAFILFIKHDTRYLLGDYENEKTNDILSIIKVHMSVSITTEEDNIYQESSIKTHLNSLHLIFENNT